MSAIRELETPADLRLGYPVLKELRAGLRMRDFLAVYRAARAADGYALAGLFVEGRCAAVIGYRVLTDYVHGRHLYIDDLVTSAAYRSRGLGAELLGYAQRRAKALKCPRLRLCTGTENAAARRFYEREGWELRSVAFKKAFSPRTRRAS